MTCLHTSPNPWRAMVLLAFVWIAGCSSGGDHTPGLGPGGPGSSSTEESSLVTVSPDAAVAAGPASSDEPAPVFVQTTPGGQTAVAFGTQVSAAVAQATAGSAAGSVIGPVVAVIMSPDAGASFTTTVLRPTTNETITKGFTPVLAQDTTGARYVAWSQLMGGKWTIQFSTDRLHRGTFSAPATISAADRQGRARPSIAASPDGAHLLVAWEEGRVGGSTGITLGISTDGGTTFTAPRELDGSPAAQLSPRVAVTPSGVMYLVWQDYRNRQADLYLATNRDGFATARRLTEDPLDSPRAQLAPSIAVDEVGTVAIAWEDYAGGHGDILVATSRDDFRTAVRVNDNETNPSQTGTDQRAPAIVGTHAQTFYIVWEDLRTVGRNGIAQHDIFVAKTTDGGMSFGTNVKVNPSALSGRHLAASLAVSNGQVYVLWTNEPDTCGIPCEHTSAYLLSGS